MAEPVKKADAPKPKDEKVYQTTEEKYGKVDPKTLPPELQGDKKSK